MILKECLVGVIVFYIGKIRAKNQIRLIKKVWNQKQYLPMQIQEQLVEIYIMRKSLVQLFKMIKM